MTPPGTAETRRRCAILHCRATLMFHRELVWPMREAHEDEAGSRFSMNSLTPEEQAGLSFRIMSRPGVRRNFLHHPVDREMPAQGLAAAQAVPSPGLALP